MFTFRNAQYEYNLFDLYAAPEIAQHLEALAQQGWQLEHIGPVFWRYRKCPPADLHYAVVYFPKDPADEYISRQQRELWELCRHYRLGACGHGWADADFPHSGERADPH